MLTEKVMFSEQECDTLLNCMTDTWHLSGVYTNYKQSKEPSIRNSTQSDFTFKPEVKKIILDKLKEFDIVNLSDNGRILKYEIGETFVKHRDATSDRDSRVKTLVIQLSHPNEYDGGDLNVWINNKKYTANKTRGNVVLFSSMHLHEATQVTNGTRYCFVTWLGRNDLNMKQTII